MNPVNPVQKHNHNRGIHTELLWNMSGAKPFGAMPHLTHCGCCRHYCVLSTRKSIPDSSRHHIMDEARRETPKEGFQETAISTFETGTA
ncbi:hypothetical protein CCHR01_00067 [Colletotrichum chrysophilum]|uniref:Uncharacterized protein n=1 Tax=Colletotrichum chrysophilum TaxID=1836956 RepID=A0AAD9AZB7_9PEZI|nr:hypothetical protein CCHR01_00067 [Colletotrichum chrysophilum]